MAYVRHHALATPLDVLTPNERLFVEAYVQQCQLGDEHGARTIAAAAAGYSTTGKSASSRGSQLMKSPKIREAIRWQLECVKTDPGEVLANIEGIRQLALHGTPDATKLAARKLLLEISGHGPVKTSEHNVNVEHRVAPPPPEALRQRLAELIAGASPETRALVAEKYGLPAPSPVIDAEFSEAPHEPEEDNTNA